MSRKYGLGTGLQVSPNTNNEELQQLLQPIHTAINSLAQTTSDVTGNTAFDLSDLQGLKPTTLFEQTGELEFIFFNNSAATRNYGDFVYIVDDVAFLHPAGYTTTGSGPGTGYPVVTGFVSEPGGIPPTSHGRVTMLRGIVRTSPTLVPGKHYYLSISGQLTTVAPATLRPLKIGIAVATDRFLFDVSSLNDGTA